MSIGRRKHSPAFALGGRTGEVLRQPGHQDRRAPPGCAWPPEDRFQPFLACHALDPGSGPDRETCCCGPLRTSNGGAMAGSGRK